MFPNPDCAIIIADGFDHIALALEEEKKELEDSDPSDVEEGAEESKKVIEVVKEEPLEPTQWDCGVCTFINPLSLGTCDACTSPRPPMADIIAAFQAALSIGKEKEEKPGEG